VETCTWTCVGAGGGTCTASGSGNISNTVNLPAGGSVTYTASCAISASATGSLSNTATVTAPAGVTDTNPANNSATDTDTLGAVADLSITKTDGATSVVAGSSTIYTIVASNAGPSAVTGATVTDTFPMVETCTWTCAGAGGGTCTASGSGNIADTVNLPAGGSVSYSASCSVSAAATGSVSNTASIAAPAGVSDPNAANDSATDVDTVTPAPTALLAATKTVASVGGSYTPGSAITYSVVISNTGTAAQADNPGDEFTDTLPAGLTLTSATATSGTTSTTGNVVHWNGAVPAGGSVTITINATINSTAGGAISNQGTVFFDADANGSNESSAVTDDPALGGGTDPTTFTVAGLPAVIVPVPGPHGWTLLLLGLGLLGLAWQRGRRLI
ncbi:MAG: DUF11 domain-containing protein, partial [Xanthomonadaceae bacterium]|nr:DUF11 domain-containing protein [Xanthomonadaceae bacterium]